jgi:hypothetical protein
MFIAHFDGKVIVPDEPVDLPINVPLILTVRIVTDAVASLGSQQSAINSSAVKDPKSSTHEKKA